MEYEKKSINTLVDVVVNSGTYSNIYVNLIEILSECTAKKKFFIATYYYNAYCCTYIAVVWKWYIIFCILITEDKIINIPKGHFIRGYFYFFLTPEIIHLKKH